MEFESTVFSLATGLKRYRRMVSNSTMDTQGAVERYGELLFEKIEKLPMPLQIEVLTQAKREA